MAATGFSPLAIVRTAPEAFVGEGEQIIVEFTADTAQDEPEEFPEPPVILRHRDGTRACSIDQGGIWVRSKVMLNADETVLLMEEYSGANRSLVLYATDDCRVVKTIDVSQRLWSITGDELMIGRDCASESVSSCTRKVLQRLTTGDAAPAVPRSESKQPGKTTEATEASEDAASTEEPTD